MVTPEVLHIPDERFFNDPKNKKYGEAWHASLFARGLSTIYPYQIRMGITNSFPDFEIKGNGAIHRFELTEAIAPGYKRGLIYKRETDIDRFPIKWFNNDEASSFIHTRVRKKTEKNYPHDANLLVNVDFKISDELDVKKIRNACEPYFIKWQSIWLLLGISIIQLFPSKDFGLICQEPTKIPGFRLEQFNRMNNGLL